LTAKLLNFSHSAKYQEKKKDDWWFFAEEAIDLGFCDEVLEEFI